jgi:hypothetical protein
VADLIKLGDVATCRECGAQSEPLHDRGGPLIATWRNGPFPRHLTAGTASPIRCAWCNDLALGFPALINRPTVGEAWEVGGPLKKYLVPPWGPAALVPRPDPHAVCSGCNDSGTPLGRERGEVFCACAAGQERVRGARPPPPLPKPKGQLALF